MSTQLLDVKYKCMHPSCVVNCREGALTMDEAYFKELTTTAAAGEGVFRSPRGVCRMGFAQQFQAVSVEKVAEADSATAAEAAAKAAAEDPIAMLKGEHQVVLALLDKIEDQVRKRDIEGLWAATNELLNDVTLHSIKKEEEVLFPLLSELIPFGAGLVAIVKEDHVEFLSLLHSFRMGLRLGEIRDGVITSVLVNLRTHIRKEDYEFFELVEKGLTDDLARRLYAGMSEIEKAFVPEKAGSRIIEDKDLLEKAELHEEAVMQARNNAQDSASGCCH